MKNQLKIAGIALFVSGALCLSSCGNSEQPKGGTDSAQNKGQADYTCPMHPEVHGKKGETCPKCGMELQPNENPQTSNVYFIQYASLPATIETGKEVTLSLTPKIKGKETDQVPLDVVHEKKIHLIVANKDLSWFEHIHPEYQADGSYQVKTTFPAGGQYVLFADYTPSGAEHQVEKINVTVSGTPAKETTYSTAVTTWKNGDIEVSLSPEGGKYATGATLHIAGSVKQKGKAVDANTLDNFLGAKAHMVIVKTGTYEYIHVHPEVEDGNLDLHAAFDSPGIYRAWLQFQLNGQVYTSDFVLNVEQGTADNSSMKDMKHDEHHDH